MYFSPLTQVPRKSVHAKRKQGEELPADGSPEKQPELTVLIPLLLPCGEGEGLAPVTLSLPARSLDISVHPSDAPCE